MSKETEYMKMRWAWKKLIEWLKKNCLDIEVYRLGDMKYCIEKYFETRGEKKPHKKTRLILFQEYNNPRSPIFKGVKVPGLTLKKETKKEKKNKYEAYLNSIKWRQFKASIIKERGARCEKCRTKTKSLDLHHKTYARLFNELRQDVMLLCRPCHKQFHNEKNDEISWSDDFDEMKAYELVNYEDPLKWRDLMYDE